MSHIHVSPEAVAASRKASAPAGAELPTKNVPSGIPDHEMTQPWSIGVTSAPIQRFDSGEAQAAVETCPPEVYIG